MSQLFEPFRAIGYVCDAVPAALQQRGTETFVAVAVGRAYQLYSCDRLNLLFVGPMQRERIRALAQLGDLTFAACGADVSVCRRGREVATYAGRDAGRVSLLLVLGTHLLAISKGGTVNVWDTSDGELWASFHTSEALGAPTACAHPPTYLNKALLGGSTGAMELWNVRTQKCIYRFKGWGSAITVLQPSPAVDVVGVGLADGRIVLHNVLADETLCTFRHEAAVTALAFRTDGTPWLLSGDTSGCVAVWDLDTRRIHCMNKAAHSMAVTSMACLPHQPVLLTASPDNSMKMWVFDGADGGAPRMLRSREGHSAPPTRVCYHGEEKGKFLLSGGLDRAVRATNIVADRQAREMSQRHVLKKRKFTDGPDAVERLTPLRGVAVSDRANGRWPNAITCHVDDANAYTWQTSKKVISKHKCSTTDKSAVTSVEISACGNFGFVGSARGRVEKYNMQSGVHRGTFGDATTGHSGAVHGIVSDRTNQVLITGSYDGTVKLWDFGTRDLRDTIEIGSAVTMMQLHRENGLLVVAADDMVLRVYDTECGGSTLVRKFTGHTNRVSDISFSSDGRWLISAAMDSTVRVWDLPQGRCIDCFGVQKPVTSLSFSPTGNFLATTHVDEVGIFLWANKQQFSHVILRPPPRKPAVADMPNPSAGGATASGGSVEVEDELADTTLRMDSVEQLAPELTTFSSVPKSQWMMLAKLDVVKERNKPEAPPKKPELAPFFLEQTWDDSKISEGPKFVAPDKSSSDGTSSGALPASRELKSAAFAAAETVLQKRLREAEEASGELCSSGPGTTGSGTEHGNPSALTTNTVATAACMTVIETLKGLSPSAVDFELRSLSDDLSGKSLLRMLQVLTTALQVRGTERLSHGSQPFVLGLSVESMFHMPISERQMLQMSTQSRRDFEVTQAYLHSTLRLHSTVIARSARYAYINPVHISRPAQSSQRVPCCVMCRLRAQAEQLAKAQDSAWQQLQGLFQHTSCLVSFLSNVQVS